MRQSIICIFLLSTLSIFGQQLKLDKIDSLGQIILEKSNTIGSYVLIRKNDSLVYSKSFGYNDLESKTKINDSTIFPISSNTKAFNGVLISQLVKQQKIDFNKPLINYLPNLELSDNYLTNNLNLIDLLTHRWGIPRYDFTYYLMTEEEKKEANKSVFNKLKYLQTTTAFRTNFQYGNNQYILASYLVEQIEKVKWEKLLATRILIPLKMFDTHCDLELFKTSLNKSIGYQNRTRTDIEMTAPLYDVSGMGNMFSSIRDLDKWTRFLLKGNDSILSKEFIAYNFKNHFSIGYEEPYKGFSSMGYGIGWYTFDYFGHKVVLHHGDNIGHQSLVVLLPDDNISWVVIANEGMKPYGFPFTMSYSLLDQLFGDRSKDWCEIQLSTQQLDHNDSLKNKAQQKVEKLKSYVGKYVHEGFGQINIFKKNNSLMIKAGTYSEKLRRQKKNTFTSYSEEFKVESTFIFKMNTAGEITSILTDLIEPNVPFIEFKKWL